MANRFSRIKAGITDYCHSEIGPKEWRPQDGHIFKKILHEFRAVCNQTIAGHIQQKNKHAFLLKMFFVLPAKRECSSCMNYAVP
jgi:hypothetical protein